LRANINPKNVEKRIKEDYGIILAGAVYRHPCHLEPIFRNDKKILNIENDFHQSEIIAQSHICLPIYNGMKQEDIEYVVSSLDNLLNKMLKEK